MLRSHKLSIAIGLFNFIVELGGCFSFFFMVWLNSDAGWDRIWVESLHGSSMRVGGVILCKRQWIAIRAQ
jgi:hypothetical protein